MSKKTAIIIVTLLILFIIVGLLFFYFYYARQQPQPELPEDDDVETVFPSTPSGGSGSGEPDDDSAATVPTTGPSIPKLRQITNVPTAGAVAFKDAEVTRIRYMESGTGHTKETTTETTDVKRVTNTTIPRVHEAFWQHTGSALVARRLKEDGETIESIYGSIFNPGEGQVGELTAKFLTNNISQATLSPTADKMFYLLKTSAGAVGTLSDLDGSKRVQIFSSPLREWLVSWPKSNIVALSTKPSGVALGYFYLLDTKTGFTSLVVSDIYGLTVLPNPDANKVLYSESRSSEVDLHLYNITANTRKTMPFSTLPEKCAWSKKQKDVLYCAIPSTMPEGTYPDTWYKGHVLFSDDIWRINTETESYDLLIKLKDFARKEIDVTKLFFDPDERYLFFTDKDSLTLWSLRLE